MPRGRGRIPWKYLPLLTVLAALPPDRPSVWLTFAELEALVGPLPAAARTGKYWTSSQGVRDNWRREGFTAQV
jgi:hypothetical protein